MEESILSNPLMKDSDMSLARHSRLTSEEYLSQVNEGSDVNNVAINLSNAIIGAGIIGLPFALKQAGFGLGLGLLFGMCALSKFSLVVLVESGIKMRCRSYENTASATLGIIGEKCVLGAQFAFDFGAALSYLIIAADTSTEVMRLFVGDDVEGLREICIAVLAFACFLPLCLKRDISALEAWSSVSVLTVCVVMVMVFVKMGVKLQTCGSHCGQFTFITSDFYNVVQSIGIFSFSFVCHDSIFLYYNSLKQGTPSRFGTMTTYALSGSAALSALLGCAGYLTFRNDTESNLLNNYQDHDILATIMRVLYVLTMILTYPICFFVCRQVLHSLLTDRTEQGELPDVRTVSTTRHLAYTMFIFLSSVGIVMLTSDLGVVMSITGNIAGSTLGYILPALIGLSKAVQVASASSNSIKNDNGSYRFEKEDTQSHYEDQNHSYDHVNNSDLEPSSNSSSSNSNFGKYFLLCFGIISFVLGIVTELY